MSRVIFKLLPAVAVAMLAVGAWLGLSWSPVDFMMGEVQRIMYVHVPAVWMALLGVTLNLGCSIAYLFKASWRTDSLAEASAEVGLFFGALGVLLGAIWGKPTWGVWWDWDPRLTTAAIMLVVYAGYLALRRFVDDPEKRAIWSAVVGIIAYVDIPLVWFSVRWRSLHQLQSSPRTIDPEMVFTLRWNAFAFLVLLVFFIWARYLIAARERARETTLPDLSPARAA